MKKFLREAAKAFIRFCILAYCKVVYRVKIIGKEGNWYKIE